MANRTELQAELEYWLEVRAELRKTYLKLAGSGVQSYQLGYENVAYAERAKILRELNAVQEKIDGLQALLETRRPRRAFFAAPQDW